MLNMQIPTTVFTRGEGADTALMQRDMPFGHGAVLGFSSMDTARKFHDSLPETIAGDGRLPAPLTA